MVSAEQVVKTTQRWLTFKSFSAGPQDVPIFGPLDSSAIYIHLLHLLPTSQLFAETLHDCPHQKYFTVRPGTPNSGCTSTGEIQVKPLQHWKKDVEMVSFPLEHSSFLHPNRIK